MSNIIDLSNHTTFGIGPTAFCKTIYDIEELKKTSSCFILGKGSNILFLNKLKSPIIINKTDKFSFDSTVLYAQSGCSLSFLAKKSAMQGLSGLEWAYLLPASVGGAIKMNAGAFGKCIADTISKVGVLRNGKVVEFSARECGFSYRKSAFLDDDIILYAYFNLKKADINACLFSLFDIEQKRKAQPKGKSAGCIYKTKEKSAGWYIDKAGLKNKRIGDIFISPIHAGFFINAGKGKCEEVLRLMDYTEKCVQDKFNVTLEKEIKIVGEL